MSFQTRKTFVHLQNTNLNIFDEIRELSDNSYIYIYAFSRHFYPKRLTVHSGYTFFISMCVLPVVSMLYHWATGTLLLFWQSMDSNTTTTFKVQKSSKTSLK